MFSFICNFKLFVLTQLNLSTACQRLGLSGKFRILTKNCFATPLLWCASLFVFVTKMEIVVSIFFFFLQIENEYGYYESAYGDGGKRYAMWAASMAVSQNIGVPWIMCQQFDAPDTVVIIFFLNEALFIYFYWKY